jgi:hypothetical protein
MEMVEMFICFVSQCCSFHSKLSKGQEVASSIIDFRVNFSYPFFAPDFLLSGRQWKAITVYWDFEFNLRYESIRF